MSSATANKTSAFIVYGYTTGTDGKPAELIFAKTGHVARRRYTYNTKTKITTKLSAKKLAAARAFIAEHGRCPRPWEID